MRHAGTAALPAAPPALPPISATWLCTILHVPLHSCLSLALFRNSHLPVARASRCSSIVIYCACTDPTFCWLIRCAKAASDASTLQSRSVSRSHLTNLTQYPSAVAVLWRFTPLQDFRKAVSSRLSSSIWSTQAQYPYVLLASISPLHLRYPVARHLTQLRPRRTHSFTTALTHPNHPANASIHGCIERRENYSYQHSIQPCHTLAIRRRLITQSRWRERHVLPPRART